MNVEIIVTARVANTVVRFSGRPANVWTRRGMVDGAAAAANVLATFALDFGTQKF